MAPREISKATWREEAKDKMVRPTKRQNQRVESLARVKIRVERKISNGTAAQSKCARTRG